MHTAPKPTIPLSGLVLSGWLGLIGCSPQPDAAALKKAAELAAKVAANRAANEIFQTSRFAVVDSVATLDSLRTSLYRSSPYPRLARIANGPLDSLASLLVHTPSRFAKPLDTGSCTGEVRSQHVYPDGLQAIKIDTTLKTILLGGPALQRLGLTPEADPAAVIARLGPAAKQGDNFVIFASSQPDENQALYCDSRWTVVASFREHKLDRILLNYCFQGC